MNTDVSAYLDRAERIFRVATRFGHEAHQRQLLTVVDDYLGLAEEAKPDDVTQIRIGALRALIADRLPGPLGEGGEIQPYERHDEKPGAKRTRNHERIPHCGQERHRSR